MPAYGYAVLIVGWIVWIAAFVRARSRGTERASVVDTRARWGMAVVTIGFGILWQGSFWERPLPMWRLALSICFLAIGCVLAWTGTRALGRQWRIDAGLNPEHELVMSGPYRLVRHPIYCSMLCMFLGTGFLLAPPLLFALGAVLFLTGTEIRVRIEDGLLAARFGSTFKEYQRRVPAYIPFLR